MIFYFPVSSAGVSITSLTASNHDTIIQHCNNVDFANLGTGDLTLWVLSQKQASC